MIRFMGSGFLGNALSIFLATAALADKDEIGPGANLNKHSQSILVEAEQGIEWFSREKFYIARGNAMAIRGRVSVHADTLKALYRDSLTEKDEIYRLEASGKVIIRGPDRTAFGDKGIYDLDKSVILVEGKGLKLKTKLDTIKASESLEYWEKKKIAIARGKATATRGDKTIGANVLTVQFESGPKDSIRATRMDAIGGVKITTADEIAIGNEGVYDVIGGVVTLTGDVKITRGKSQLNGSVAEVNLQTGVSRLVSNKKLESRQKVRGLFARETLRKKRD
ncbi:MAG: hypothetical protein CMM58_01980 [Rhodospirillaceae bacterium]|nr:hypothetical protein [Rhodospirillaceae bacterium]|tara:strand:- start:1872 stop:2711 length:840 start_codon:yes stop_codon:yes gene_type:complete